MFMKRVSYIFVSVVIVLIAVVCIVRCSEGNDVKDIYADTAVNINNVELKGELYLYSEIIEDYAIEHMSEKRIWPFPDKQHAQMLIKCKRMSYVLPLDSIKVEQRGSTAVVTLPELVVIESEQALNNVNPYLSDDDDFWREHSGSVDAMVNKKIAVRFSKGDKMAKAMETARNTLRTLYVSAGFKEVVFRND